MTDARAEMAPAAMNLAVTAALKKAAQAVADGVVAEAEVAVASAHRRDNANVLMLKASPWPQTWTPALQRHQPMVPIRRLQDPSLGRTAHRVRLNAVVVVVALNAVAASARPTPSKLPWETGPSQGRTTAMSADLIAIVTQAKAVEAICRTRERPAQWNAPCHLLQRSRSKTRNRAEVPMTLSCVLKVPRPANGAHVVAHRANAASEASAWNRVSVRNGLFVRLSRLPKRLPRNHGGLTSPPARRSLRQWKLRRKKCQRL